MIWIEFGGWRGRHRGSGGGGFTAFMQSDCRWLQWFLDASVAVVIGMSIHSHRPSDVDHFG